MGLARHLEIVFCRPFPTCTFTSNLVLQAVLRMGRNFLLHAHVVLFPCVTSGRDKARN